MRYPSLPLAVSFIVLVCSAPPSDTFASIKQDRIYGQVTTEDGEIFEGLIRWDKNEASWVDILHGSKVIPDGDRQQRRRKRIEVFGVTVYEEEGYNGGAGTRTSGIRFGYVKSLEPLGNDEALLTLQSGEEVIFRHGSTDIGNEVREILVEDVNRGEIELRWRDIARIDFMQAPSSVFSAYGDRLHGTLLTRSGYEFTGFICWDLDEVLTSDILDGDDKGRRRKIRFETIDVIGRNSSSSAYVILKNGEEVVLRGTNDVNSDNNGILVLDNTLGQVEIDWDDFEEVVFTEPSYVPRFADYSSTGNLFGVVYTRDGEAYNGQIRWDDDENRTWEFLNGIMQDIEFEIQFINIRSIERISSRASEITLFDGRAYELRDSNDVDDDNNGIYVLDDLGNETIISWRDFERAVFDKP